MRTFMSIATAISVSISGLGATAVGASAQDVTPRLSAAHRPTATQRPDVLYTESAGQRAADGAQAQRSRTGDLSDRVISLRLDHATVEVALRTIAHAAGAGLVLSPDILPKDRTVSIDRDISVRDALRFVLRGTALAATVSADDQITVTRTKRAVDKGIVRGRVTSAKTKRPLEGATITVVGTQLTVRTDAEGRFELRDVPAGARTIVARNIGYAKASVEITITDGEAVVHDFALEETTNKLDEVVVTSTRVETEMRAVPVDVTVITAKDIQAKNITQVEQLFRGDVPGVFMRNSGYVNTNPFASGAGGGAVQRTPQIRGQNFLSGDESTPSQVKVYLDGVLVTDYSVVTQMDPSIIDRIEIVRGPAATTMYGSGASDGVMQIFTKRGRAGRPRWSATLAAESFDSPYKSDMVVSPRLDLSLDGGSDELAYSVTASVEREGAWIPNYKSTRRSLGGGVSKTAGPVTFSASGQYIGPNAYNNPPDPWLALGVHEGIYSRARIYTNSLAPSNTISKLSTVLGSVRMTYLATPFWSHTLTVGTDQSSSDNSKTSPTYTTLDDTLLNLYTSSSARNTISYNTSWQAHPTASLSSTLTAGFEYTSSRYDSYSMSSLPTLRGSAYGTAFTSYDNTRNTGYFGQLVLGWNESLFLTGGIRMDRNPDYGSDVKAYSQPRVALSYVIDFPADVTLKTRAAYGWATRAPSAGQKNGSSGSSYVSGNFVQETQYLANPELKPANQSGVEGGLDLYVGNFASFSITLADQTADNDIYQSSISVDTTELGPGAPAPYKIVTSQQYVNIGKMQTKSVEMSGQLQWREWGLSATYSTASNVPRSLPPQGVFTGTYGYLELGHRIPSVPTYTGGATLSYTSARFDANLSTTYMGRVEASDQLAAFNRTYGVPERDGPPLPGMNVTLPKWAKFYFNWNQHINRTTTLFTRIDNVNNNFAVEGLDTRNPKEGRKVTLGVRFVR